MEQDKEIINLAKEIIDDAELKRGSVESLVFKATRLASIVKDENIKIWLALEKFGYSEREPDLTYMAMTGRSYDKVTHIGLFGSISTQEAAIEASLAEMEVVKNFKPNGTYSSLQFNNQLQQIKNLTAARAIYKRICSVVASSIQDFATKIYYTYKFGQEADSILEEYRKTVLDGIAKYFPDLNQSFEVINKNSNNSNPREWSVATLESRNILIYLSGKLWTSREANYKCRDKQPIKVENEKNKLIAYVDMKMGASKEGKARAKKLFGIIHEIFTLGGKAKRKTEKKELSTVIIDTFVFLNDLMSYTDLKPIE
ncbi:MAG: hypothetical protein Q7R31_04710 [Candidatus Levybacteria bacterium]|nr:hypothetical protein [Candidatus Levybacteria bacterium]